MTLLRADPAGASELARVGAVRLVVPLLAAVEAGSIVGRLGRALASHVTLFLAAGRIL